MRVAVLLSCGLHPISGARVLPATEAQAIRLGAALGEVHGLHAGPDAAAVADALGQGLAVIEHLATPPDADPVPFLVARLRAAPPDIVLAGRRSQGGEESGLVPYLVARALAMTMVADVVAARAGEAPGTLSVDQSLGRGALRRLLVRGPAVLAVHPDAAPALPFAFGRARRGRIETRHVAPDAALPGAGLDAPEERPYRRRPKILRGAPAGSAADRLKAATGDSGSADGKLMIEPEPEAAAREILAYLRAIGVLAPACSRQERTHDAL